MTESIAGPAAVPVGSEPADVPVVNEAAALPAEVTRRSPEPLAPQPPASQAPARATRVPPPPSARPPVEPSVPVVSPVVPPDSGSGGNGGTRSASNAGTRQPRRHRSRRSVAAITGWVEPAEIPDDAPGRVALAAGEPSPASPPLATALPGSIRAPEDVARRGGAQPPGVLGRWAFSGWPVIAVLCVVLVVLFVIGMRMTR